MKLLKTILVFSLFGSAGCFNTTESTSQSISSQQDEDYKTGENYYLGENGYLEYLKNLLNS